MERITAAVLNYNGIETLLDTIQSLYDQKGVKVDVILMDDCSDDGSPEAVRARFPAVQQIVMSENSRQVSYLRNEGIRAAKTSKVLIIDNDQILEPNCVAELLRVFNQDACITCCIPRLMYRNEPDKVNMCGGKIHYIGASICPERDKKLVDAELKTETGIGGGIALLDRQVFLDIGGFDEAFMLAWGDDGELHQRMLLAGFKSMYVHNAVGYHDVKPFSKARQYRAVGQTYNRWMFLLTHYDIRTLVLMIPALTLYEVVQLAFFTINGFPHLYFQANWKVIKSLPLIKEKRRQKQRLKTVSDKEIVFSGPIVVVTSKVGFGSLVTMAIKGVSSILNGYWRLISPLIR